jgi:cellobiose epimerase
MAASGIVQRGSQSPFLVSTILGEVNGSIASERCTTTHEKMTESVAGLAPQYARCLSDGILKRWYPLVLDRECGGYYTNVTHDWLLPPEQEKMIVSQARHLWTTSKVTEFFEKETCFEKYARHGYEFLRDILWDTEYGGFYQIRGRSGGFSDVRGWRNEKRTYGNAFAIFALAAFYHLTHEPQVLDLARQAFSWIEDHAYDPKYGGYFQFLGREGIPFDNTGPYKTIALDGNEIGFKDQNSSIHLMEAYTELYHTWKDPRVRDQLSTILSLIRDVMVTDRGYLQLFFHPDLTGVSFRDAPRDVREKNYVLDHISFGHDYETAFLMLEASYTLGLRNDVRTLAVAKKMLDHALENGWDRNRGGFFDGGYYFKGDSSCTILKDTKNWWAQAEALNVLLIFSRIFPGGDYAAYLRRQWEYVSRYVIDWDHGDWYEGGLDKEPQFATGPKSHMWKCTYHTSRALMNGIAIMSDARQLDPGILNRKRELDGLIEHWKKVATFFGSENDHHLQPHTLINTRHPAPETEPGGSQ